MTNTQASQFVTALFREVFEQFDRKKVEKFFSKDMTGFLLSEPADFDSIIKWMDRLEANYDRLESTVHQVIVEGHKIAAVVNIKLHSSNGDDESPYTSICIFMEHNGKGKVIRWRTFTS